MRRPSGRAKRKHRDTQGPIFIEKDEDGFYVVECPLFEGCYSQGKTVDEALRNIREVIDMILEEQKNREILNAYQPRGAEGSAPPRHSAITVTGEVPRAK